jgi:hypothetical protein
MQNELNAMTEIENYNIISMQLLESVTVNFIEALQ